MQRLVGELRNKKNNQISEYSSIVGKHSQIILALRSALAVTTVPLGGRVVLRFAGGAVAEYWRTDALVGVHISPPRWAHKGEEGVSLIWPVMRQDQANGFG